MASKSIKSTRIIKLTKVAKEAIKAKKTKEILTQKWKDGGIEKRIMKMINNIYDNYDEDEDEDEDDEDNIYDNFEGDEDHKLLGDEINDYGSFNELMYSMTCKGYFKSILNDIYNIIKNNETIIKDYEELIQLCHNLKKKYSYLGSSSEYIVEVCCDSIFTNYEEQYKERDENYEDDENFYFKWHGKHYLL